MKILVLQHERIEHPGIFRSFLAADGHTWEAVELDEGETLPDLEGYDALWVMGGPMDTWQEDAHPWLHEEKRFIRRAVLEKGMPFLGFCLGHQLLAESLGGTVGPSQTPENGIMTVDLTDTGASGGFVEGLPNHFRCSQWHSAEVTKIPEDAQILASSPACRVQAMSWGIHAFSMQFHIEIEADTVDAWSHIPEYATALEAAMGKGSVPSFEAQAAENMQDFNRFAKQIYTNWMRAVAQA